jgi:hypothetical protein
MIDNVQKHNTYNFILEKHKTMARDILHLQEVMHCKCHLLCTSTSTSFGTGEWYLCISVTSYSPDLAPADYHLFPKMKPPIKGHRLQLAKEVMRLLWQLKRMQ